jgi:hypothetical protein
MATASSSICGEFFASTRIPLEQDPDGQLVKKRLIR